MSAESPKPLRMMFTPCPASACAKPSPIPLVKPVIKAVLFLSIKNPVSECVLAGILPGIAPRSKDIGECYSVISLFHGPLAAFDIFTAAAFETGATACARPQPAADNRKAAAKGTVAAMLMASLARSRVFAFILISPAFGNLQYVFIGHALCQY